MGWTAPAEMMRKLTRRGRAAASTRAGTSEEFSLVRHATTLQDIARVERHLPEILGRALARSWIDPHFAADLLADPKGLLARYEVFLPANVVIQVEANPDQRQRIVVYDRGAGGALRRLMYLQLVMMAGR